MTSVSVAMATYCGERFLREQLDSIASQTIKPLELVVCDDASTDRTKSILAEFAATAPFPVHIHHNETRLGYIDNFLRAIALCKGTYVALSDQDDFWFETKLETALARLEETGACLHSHSATVVDDEGTRSGDLRPLKRTGRVSYDDFSPWDTFFGFTCTFKRDLMAAVPIADRPIDLIHGDKLMAHDRWITHLALAAGRVEYTDTPLAAYRQHETNAFGVKGRGVWRKVRKFRGQYLAYIGKRASIAEAMAAISRQFGRGAPTAERSPAAVWQALAQSYTARRDIFASQNGLARRAAALVRRYRFTRDWKGFTMDLAAAFVLAL